MSFEFIKEVKDPQFHQNLSQLFDECQNIKSLVESPGGQAQAVALMRVANEKIIHYLFDVLGFRTEQGKKWEISAALDNPAFKRKVESKLFISLANQIRNYGNAEVHSHANKEGNVELAYEALFNVFETCIKMACNIVDNQYEMKQKEPSTQMEKQSAAFTVTGPEAAGKLSGEISLAVITEDGDRYLVATVNNCQTNPNDLMYVWKICEGSKTLGIAQDRSKKSRLKLPTEPDGTQYACVVNSDIVEGRLSRKYTDKLPQKRKTGSQRKKPEVEKKKSKETYLLQNTGISISDAVVPMRWPEQTPKLFDSSSGLTHYFVRPDDNFVLNSFEMLDADAYLYRVLKRENYERVAFVEVSGTECRIYIYDEQSESVFKGTTAPKKTTEKKGPQGLMGVKVHRTEEKPATSSKNGHRCIRRFSRGEEFIKQFAAEIGQALRNQKQKTAVVMPMSIFGKNGYCGEPVIDTINEIERLGNYGNILLLTMPRRTDIAECFENNHPRLHSSWANAVLNAMRQDNIDIVQESIRQLNEQGLIVLADEYQPDEIANLLLRKKHVFKSPGFDRIPTSKIYALAEIILSHCMQEKEEFPHPIFPFIKRKEHCIRQLNSILDEPAVQEVLLARLQKMKGVQIGFSQEIDSLNLRRVYHQSIIRYKNSNVESEIKKEFHTYVGEEMMKIKTDIFDAVRMFEDEQRHLQAEKDAGRTVQTDDMPYMNFRFVGPPGSGKTSIAGLTARYLNARGILPTSKVHIVNATQMIRSHPGETAQLLREAAERADGGVLIIDEFQGFESAYQGGNIAQDAMRALVQIVNEKRTSLCIIAAGYEADVDKVFTFDDGAARRFPHTVHFQNYSLDSLMVILMSVLKKRGWELAPDAELLVKRVIEADKSILGDQFGNAGYLKDSLVPKLNQSRLRSGEDRTVFTREDVLAAFPEKQNLLLKTDKTSDDVLREFDAYVGSEMQHIKEEVISAVDTFDFLRSMPQSPNAASNERQYPYMNMRFVGPPGTGKTSIAKLTAKYMNAKGILPRDSVETINATELIRGTVGDTARLIREAAARANGGILIIDEFHGFENAYQGGNVAKDAMEAITSVLNKYGDTLCIIAAGYENGIKKVLGFDPGAERRFPYIVHFASYSVSTLITILKSNLEAKGIKIEPMALDRLRVVIEHDMKEQGSSFGNGGYLMDSLFPKLVRPLAARRATGLSSQKKTDLTIAENDVLAAFPGIFGKDDSPTQTT